MNDRVRNIELAALACATDADGRVDFTRFEARRLILGRQQIDGIDADAIVRDITSYPAFAQGGPRSARPLLDAIRANVSPGERLRFNDALDRANHWDGAVERAGEAVGGGIKGLYTDAREGISAADARVTQALGEWRQWADGGRNSSENTFLQRAAATMAASGIGTVQENYGRLRGATIGAVDMLGDTVDLAHFAARFATDQDFRNLMIGAAAVYANDVREGKRSPVDDVTRAARGAWNEWQVGLERAQQNGTADQYLGTAEGRIGVELLAAVVPVTKLARFGRLATAMDVDAPNGAVALPAREAAREAREIISDLSDGARAAQRSTVAVVAESGDLFFKGLAGVRRSQAELRGLVDEMRIAGNLDGLLASGALRPMELGYLVRTDPAAFRGEVSFEQAITAYVGDRPLTSLGRRETGDIGEAFMANHLAQQGYRDIVPVQNTSGQGVDITATDPAGGVLQMEVKASVHGSARNQRGDPVAFLESRLALAEAQDVRWEPRNIWEEDAVATAIRIRNERYDPITGQLDVDAYWGRINIELDGSGVIRGTPDIQPWRAQEQPTSPTPQQAAVPDQQASNFVLPADFRSPSHPGKGAFDRASEEVRRMEASNGIASGLDSERLAGVVAVTVERERLQLHHLELGKDGKVQAVEIGPYPEFQRRSIAIDSAKAITAPLDQSAAEWAQLRSPLYRSQSGPGVRTGEQAALLDQLSPEDTKLFSKIRDSVPGQVPDEQIVLATLRAKQAGITDERKLQTAALAGDSLLLVGNTPGFRERLNLSEQVPSMQDTVNQMQTFNTQQREMQLAQEREQQQSQSQARSLSA